MIPHSHISHERTSDDCPSLVDLAALSEGRLTGEALERLEAHVARCEACLDLVCGLRAETLHIEDESRLILVPAHVLTAAMNLRSGDSNAEIIVTTTQGARGLWLTGARRGLAAAAALAIIATGYQVGRSFNATTAASASADSDANGLTFGLLDATTSLGYEDADTDDEGLGLFTIALKEGQS